MALANELVGELWMTSLIAFFDAVGHDLTIQAMRPLLRLHGAEGWLRMRDNLALDDDPLVMIAHTVNIGTASAGLPSKTEIAERGVIQTVYDCPFGRTGKDIFCIVHSFLHEGLYEVIDPGYASRHLKWLPHGDPFCQHVIIRREVPPERWNDCGEVLCTLTRPNVPTEQVMMMGRELVGDLFVLTIQAFVDTAGSREAVAVLRPLMVKCGRAAGLKIARRVSADEVDALEGVLVHLSDSMRQSATVRVEGDRLSLNVRGCPFEDAPDEVCELFDAFVEGVCLEVEPESRPTIGRAGEGGTVTCCWSVRRGDGHVRRTSERVPRT